MGAFGCNFSDFRAIWLGTTKPKLQNRYGAVVQNIQTFISNLGYLWLTRTSESIPHLPSSQTPAGLVIQVRTSPHFPGRTYWAFNFRQLWEGIVSLLFVSRAKTQVLRTRVDLCYHYGPFPAVVGKLFKPLLVQTLFFGTFEEIYRYGCVRLFSWRVYSTLEYLEYYI